MRGEASGAAGLESAGGQPDGANPSRLGRWATEPWCGALVVVVGAVQAAIICLSFSGSRLKSARKVVAVKPNQQPLEKFRLQSQCRRGVQLS